MDLYSENNRTNNKDDNYANRRRSIRDISLSEELEGKRRPARRTRKGSARDGYYKRGANTARTGLLLLVFVLLAFGGVLTVSIFSKAVVRVETKKERISVDESISISESGSGETPLVYEIFSLEEIGTKALQGSEEKEVERSAQGKITIYNRDSQDHVLIGKTRFESEDGNIYRISSSVEIPAARSVDTPGSATVTVQADEPGESFNLSKGDLTVPGLKGSDLYSKITASVASPIEGGFVGVEFSVTEEEEEKAVKEIQNNLTESLQRKASSSLPGGYYLVPDSVFLEFDDLPNKVSDNQVVLQIKATLYGVMLKKDLLAGFLASEYVDSYDNMPVEIENWDDLSVAIDKKQLTFQDIENEVEVSISGSVDLRWKLDEESLRELLAGTPREDATKVAMAVSGVKFVRIELTPSFLRTIPTNTEKIDVIVENN